MLGRYAEAGHAFDRAIASMDAGDAAEWTDISPLLDGGLRDLLAAADEPGSAGRDMVVSELWRLADPLFTDQG